MLLCLAPADLPGRVGGWGEWWGGGGRERGREAAPPKWLDESRKTRRDEVNAC